jgi:hypothetical protein
LIETRLEEIARVERDVAMPRKPSTRGRVKSVRRPRQTVVPPPEVAIDDEPTLPRGAVLDEHAEKISRAMYSAYLAGDIADAFSLAERVLAHKPDHGLARVVLDQCQAVLSVPDPEHLRPSSVLRIRPSMEDAGVPPLDPTSVIVLGHVDGISEAARVVERAGVPRAQGFEHLHTLINLGVLEVVA